MSLSTVSAKDNHSYKRYNVAVPSSSRRGEHNFRINEHVFECFCKATFNTTRDWQRHLSTYHNLPIESIREIMGRDFHAQSSTVFNGTVGDDQAYSRYGNAAGNACFAGARK